MIAPLFAVTKAPPMPWRTRKPMMAVSFPASAHKGVNGQLVPDVPHFSPPISAPTHDRAAEV